MNYIQIVQTGDNPKIPPTVIQMFSDEQLRAFKFWLKKQDILQLPNFDTAVAHSNMINLLRQWEDKNGRIKMSKRRLMNNPLEQLKDMSAKTAFNMTATEAREQGLCINCKSPPIFYSQAGRKEYGISGLGEYCFDTICGEGNKTCLSESQIAEVEHKPASDV